MLKYWLGIRFVEPSLILKIIKNGAQFAKRILINICS